ncbi:HET-domain-containing protein [Xylariaceae sp. AK1471]|nr:HET-domain-containing protein [Xylariaceae sp. AK1471]
MSTFPGVNNAYRYQALDATRQQIRLIKLEKSISFKLPPRCSIHAFDLTSAPKYIALSYTWGPPSGPSYRILVDSKTFEVRENLYNFLCSFQTGSMIKTDIAYIYIDQICINQENLQEKNGQVRLMSGIYAQSSLVVVWLGSDPKMVKAAHAVEDDMENADELHVPTGNIRIIISNVYFTRLWIVQEVSLAREIRMLIGDCELWWAAAEFAASRIDPMSPANRLGTLKDLFKEKNHKKEWRLDTLVSKYSVHECQDPRDKVYGFLGMIPESQRPVVDYAKSTHQVFLDVIPIVLDIYWQNKPTEVIYNDRFYGHFRVYLENMLKLAWNMKFPDHDQRGLISLFKQIVVIEDELSRNLDEPSLTFTDMIDGFGYETVDPGEADGGEGVLMGRWWMAVGSQKHYHDCRTAIEPLRQLFAWKFLRDVQLKATWPGKEAEEANLQRLLDPNDRYPYDSESDGCEDFY